MADEIDDLDDLGDLGDLGDLDIGELGDEPVGDATGAKKTNRKRQMIIGIASFLLLGGGAYFFMGSDSPDTNVAGDRR